MVFGGVLGIITSWNAFVIGSSRLLFAMSRGGMLREVFSRLHPKYESPVAVIVLITAITAAAPFFGRHALVWLVDAGGLAVVVGYFLVTVSFLRIRATHPDLPRPYRTPAGGLVGILAMLATLFFIALYLPWSPSALVWPQEWLIIVAWAALGVLFGLGARARVAAMGRVKQEDLILGEYAEMVRQSPITQKRGPQ